MPVAATATMPGLNFRVASNVLAATPADGGSRRWWGSGGTVTSTMWKDLSTRVITGEWGVGRTNTGPLAGVEGQTATFRLLNQDRKLDRLSTGSSFYRRLVPGRIITLSLNWNGTTYDQWGGTIDEVRSIIDMSGQNICEITATDNLGRVSETIVPRSTNAAYLNLVAAYNLTGYNGPFLAWTAEAEYSTLSIGLASTRFPESMWAGSTWGVSIGQLFNEYIALEGGHAMAVSNRSGKVIVWGANDWRYSTRARTSRFTFSSTGTAVPFSDLTFRESRDDIVNEVVVDVPWSTERLTYSSTQSKNYTGVRAISLSLNAPNDALPVAVARGTVWRWKDQRYGVETIQAEPQRKVATFPTVLAWEPGDRCTVKWRTIRGAAVAGSTYTLDHYLMGWTGYLDATARTISYSCTLQSAVQMFATTGAQGWARWGESTGRLGF